MMCVVSMVGDYYRDRFEKRWSDAWPATPLPAPTNPFAQQVAPIQLLPQITRQEFDDLKREVLEMKELLKRAKKYDEDNGEPDCEIDEKMDLLRRVAKMVGVSLDDVIAPQANAVA